MHKKKLKDFNHLLYKLVVITVDSFLKYVIYFEIEQWHLFLSYLLVHKNYSKILQVQTAISYSFWVSGTWQPLRQMVLTQYLTNCSQDSGWATVTWRLECTWMILFQDGSLTRLLAGGLSSLLWGLSPGLLECPSGMAARFSHSKQSKRKNKQEPAVPFVNWS